MVHRLLLFVDAAHRRRQPPRLQHGVVFVLGLDLHLGVTIVIVGGRDEAVLRQQCGSFFDDGRCTDAVLLLIGSLVGSLVGVGVGVGVAPPCGPLEDVAQAAEGSIGRVAARGGRHMSRATDVVPRHGQTPQQVQAGVQRRAMIAGIVVVVFIVASAAVGGGRLDPIEVPHDGHLDQFQAPRRPPRPIPHGPKQVDEPGQDRGGEEGTGLVVGAGAGSEALRPRALTRCGGIGAARARARAALLTARRVLEKRRENVEDRRCDRFVQVRAGRNVGSSVGGGVAVPGGGAAGIVDIHGIPLR
mmetsp:Transcript_40665/g.122436  ORF Transcript_40665/g.122436 Transcript_40665/m.122436 type:complete len:301 (-) Transcript_40665:40-942(-)